MPGPRYFDPFETPRSADGRFAEKEGSAPEVAVEAGISYADAVAHAEEILRALLPSGQFIHTTAPGSEQRVSTTLILDDLP